MRKFAAIVYNEVLLNSKRVAPYALIILFSGVAVLGWARGPALALGWATNSDFYIARGLKAFSFLFGVPIFNAMIMGDAVIRDFRLRIDPLIFSKPPTRAQYLFGKFFGNFLVLVCCMAAFPLTQLALQAFHPAQMVVQPFKVLPYLTHFFFFVVISQFAFAAFFFMVGALTRNNKIVYFLAISFYPIFIASMLFLLRGWTRGKILFDPFLLNSGPSKNGFGNSAEYLNQYVYSYTPEMVLNRVGLILLAVVCLTWLYVRFTTTDRSKKTSLAGVSFALSTATDNVTYESDHVQEIRPEHDQKAVLKKPTKLKNSFRSPFFAIFQNEVLLNSKRVAPYLVALLSAGNAVLWWGWGPATGRNMATNSDAFIAGVLPFFCFLFQPLLAMVVMADPTIRDLRTEINPLIFSKPVSRGEYLMGKFFGNFFTLSCCQFMFSATLFVLQWVPKHGMVVQEAKFLAYPKHFLAYVVISYLPLAAFYFTVGTLTRNVKIVYGAGLAIYPLFISYALVFLKRLPWRWGALLDPLLINWGNRQEIHATSAELFNQLVIVYDSIFIANRIGMILLTAICLTILYKFFSTTERSAKTKELTVIKLSTAAEGVYYPDRPQAISLDKFDTAAYRAQAVSTHVTVPKVAKLNKGIRSNINKLIAAIGVEFRLLRAERSLVVVMPLALFLSLLEVAFYPIHSDISLTAAYATNTATSLLIFLIGMAVFYPGEAMHRDREIRIEPFLWTTPISNSVLIMSKFLSTLLLLFALILSIGVAAVVIQIIRQHTPIDLVAYLKVYGLILLPSAFILAAISVLGSVVLRNKYAFYVVSIGTASALFYLFSNGYNHWLYNPVMYRLWNFGDLIGSASLRSILWRRAVWLAIATGCLAIAHLFFPRKTNRRRVTMTLVALTMSLTFGGRVAAQSSSSALALTHITVIDMTGAPPHRDMTVVVTGNRITDMGTTNHVRIPRNARIINAAGKFLIPGLWDMHVHFTRVDTTFPLFIANGVTGVRNMGGDLDDLLRWRADVRAGKLLGPQIVTCGPIVDGPEPAAQGPTIVVKNEAEARAAVDSLKQRAADCVKVYDKLPRDAYFAIIDEARKQSLPVVGHTPLSITTLEASDAGQKSIEHLGSILEGSSSLEAALFDPEKSLPKVKDPSEFPRRLAARGRRMLDTYDSKRAANIFAHFVKNQTWQVPTLDTKYVLTFIDSLFAKADDRLKYVPAADQRWWSPTKNFFARYRTAEYISYRYRLWQKELDLVRDMHRAGVPFMTGTDLGGAYTFPGFSVHHELELFVQAGFTPMEALQAATRNPAIFLGQSDSSGTVERGKVANLVLLDANPLNDIRNTQRINAVVLNGRLLPRAELDKLLRNAALAASN